MSLRDIALALLMCVITPLGLFHPWMGVMSWAFVSLFSPHRSTWGFMMDAPVSLLTGGATLLGMLLTRDPKRLPMAAPVIWLILFSAWMVVTYPFSLDPGPDNFEQLDKVLKIMLMNLVAIAVISTRRQVDVLIWVCALSVGFYGVKGGIFALMTGGQYAVRGVGGFIAGNNEIALALVITVPLLYYLHLTSTRPWIRYGMIAAASLTVLAAVASQSRGALVATLAMTAAFVARSPNRGRVVIPLLITVVLIAVFMPQTWWDRMASIGTYEADPSAMGRINAWKMAWNIATDRFFGGGFYLESDAIFGRYAPDPFDIHVAHSIYFQVLGQHGFVGLFLFLGMWFSTWRTARWIAKNAVTKADAALARMIEFSIVGYAAGGAFLNLAYYDGVYYLLVALVVVRYKLMNAPVPVPGAADPGTRKGRGEQRSTPRGAGDVARHP